MIVFGKGASPKPVLAAHFKYNLFFLLKLVIAVYLQGMQIGLRLVPAIFHKFQSP
jgi:hypothetical protein